MNDLITRMINSLKGYEMELEYEKRLARPIHKQDYALLYREAQRVLFDHSGRWIDVNVKRFENAGFNVFKHRDCVVFNTKHGNIAIPLKTNLTLPSPEKKEWYLELQAY